MDSLKNSLSSLTHTTPTTHTNPRFPSAANEEDDANDGAAGGGQGNAFSTGTEEAADERTAVVPNQANSSSEVSHEFNFKEFYSLATRVIDDGDREAMPALHKLKAHWEEKFGEEIVGMVFGPLRLDSQHLSAAHHQSCDLLVAILDCRRRSRRRQYCRMWRRLLGFSLVMCRHQSPPLLGFPC